MRFRFAEFTLDLVTGELVGPSGPVALRRQAFRLLETLVRQAPALVARDVLIDSVWGRSALSPNVLPQAISELRQALGDDPAAPCFIETRHRRGYRFIAVVERADTPPAAMPEATPIATPVPDPAPASGRPLRRVLALAAALALAGVLAYALKPAAENSAGALADSVARLHASLEQARRDHLPERAVAALRALVELHPHDAALRLDLAEAELDALQGQAARATLAGIVADERDVRQRLLRSRIALLDGRTAQARALARQALDQAIEDDAIDAMLKAHRAWTASLRAAGMLGEAQTALAAIRTDWAARLNADQHLELDLERLALLREQGALGEAEALATALGGRDADPDLALRLAVELALLRSEQGHQQGALEVLEGADREGARRDPELAIALDNAWGVVLLRNGDVDAASGRFEAAFAAARRHAPGQRLAGLKVNAGLLFARQRRMPEAEALWSQALEAFAELGDLRGQGVALGNLAAAASAQGRHEQSIELNLRALRIFRELDLTGPLARTAFNLALVRGREGRLAEAETLFAEAATAYAAAEQHGLLLQVSASRADNLLLAGDLGAAEDLLAAIEIDETAPAEMRAALMAARGSLSLWRGDLEGAREGYLRARELREQAGLERWVARTDIDLLRLDFLAGADPARVRVAAEALAERFSRWDEAQAEARAWALTAEALVAQRRPAEAREALTRAKAAQAGFQDAALGFDIAWIEAWAGHPDEFEPRLQAQAQQAQALGLLGRWNQVHAVLGAGALDGQPPARHAPLGVLPPYATRREP